MGLDCCADEMRPGGHLAPRLNSDVSMQDTPRILHLLLIGRRCMIVACRV